MSDYSVRNGMKKFAAALLAVMIFLVGSMLWYRWDSRTNHGHQFGYYGEFNRVSNALASIPGITITRSWANCDLSLEEFGFTAINSAGIPVRIALEERDPIRSLSGKLLVQTLSAEVERQTKK